jgi:AbrB family transcriptional regulator, stage V sporulation protein T
MTYHAKVFAGGKVSIPADVRRQLGIKDGDRVQFEIRDGRLTMTTLAQRIREIQEHVRSIVPEGVSLVDELIAERRAEAAREQAESA